MSKLENKMFKSVENKKLTKKTSFRLYNIISITYLFMMPMIVMYLICKKFIKNQDVYLTLMSFSFFCGAYNVFRELHKIYTKKNDIEENKEEETYDF